MKTLRLPLKALFITQRTTCWSEKAKKFVFLNLDESVRNMLDEWGTLDYIVSKEVFEDDPQGVTKTMKSLGYSLVGNYTFQHYSHKKRNPITQPVEEAVE